MPSVLLVTQDLQRAGAQRQCVELALGLRQRQEWRIEVAALEPGGALAAELLSAGIPLRVCPRRWRWDLSPACRLAEQARAGKHDILHSFLFLPNFYTRLARIRYRPRGLVSSLRSTGIAGWPRYALEILMAPLCDIIIANSDSGRKGLIAWGVSPARVVVIRNGLDLARFESLRSPAMLPDRSLHRIGMMAQMEPRKDPLNLIEAFREVAATVRDAKLILGGDGSLRPAVEEAVRVTGLEGRVELPGTVERPDEVYSSLEIYVQSSAYGEGTSNSILEAMASGLPVVATNVGGNREVVIDGQTGIIVPPHDPGRLAAAILELLMDPERALRMGAAGAARVHAEFSRRTMVEATLKVYEQLLCAS